MLKLNNKNIAIIGSSPIMMLIAKFLSRRNIITVFEKKKNLVVHGYMRIY